MEASSYTAPNGSFQVQLWAFTSCGTKEIIYLIQCLCEKYAGMSCRAVQARIMEHHSKIRHKAVDASLVSRFIEGGHNEIDFSFCILAKLRKSPYPTHLLRMEVF